jgi:hypothetical protein
MSFENQEKIIAIAATDASNLFPELLEKYGEIVNDGKNKILTIGAHWDNVEKTKIRAASLANGTIAGRLLSDGRIAYMCLWQFDLAKAFNNGEIPQAEEITVQELEELTPSIEL